MSIGLLYALETHGNAKICDTTRGFTFQHNLCHDFESLIWVIVYAMMVRRRNMLAATNSKVYAAYKAELDHYWGVHSYTKLANLHDNLALAGSRRSRNVVEDLWFPDPLDAEFFRAAMRLVRSQCDGEEPITYKMMQGLFRTYIQKAEQETLSTLVTA